MKTERKIQFVWNGSDTFAMQIWICLSSYSISTGLSSTGEMRVEAHPQISRGLPNSGSGAFEIRWNVLAAQKFLLTEIVVGNPGRVSGAVVGPSHFSPIIYLPPWWPISVISQSRKLVD